MFEKNGQSSAFDSFTRSGVVGTGCASKGWPVVVLRSARVVDVERVTERGVALSETWRDAVFCQLRIDSRATAASAFKAGVASADALLALGSGRCSATSSRRVV